MKKTVALLILLVAVFVIILEVQDTPRKQNVCISEVVLNAFSADLDGSTELAKLSPYDIMLQRPVTAKNIGDGTTVCIARLYLQVSYNRTEPAYARVMARKFMLSNGYKEGRDDVYYTDVFETYLVKKDGSYGGLLTQSFVSKLSPKFEIPTTWESFRGGPPIN